MTKYNLRGSMALAAFIFALVFAPAASVQTDQCSARTNNTFRKLAECVTVAGADEHRAAFQDIADENNGYRVAAQTAKQSQPHTPQKCLSGPGKDRDVHRLHDARFAELRFLRF